MCIYIYNHTLAHKCINKHTGKDKQTNKHICTHTAIHALTYMHTYACKHTCTHWHMHMYTHLYRYTHTSSYKQIPINRQTHTHMHAHAWKDTTHIHTNMYASNNASTDTHIIYAYTNKHTYIHKKHTKYKYIHTCKHSLHMDAQEPGYKHTCTQTHTHSHMLPCPTSYIL